MAELGISNFTSYFKDGLRPNLFYVQLGDMPTHNRKFTSNATETDQQYTIAGLEDFKFFCKAASLPASSIGSVEVPFMGRNIKVAGNRTFEDWTVTVYNAVLDGTEGEAATKSLRTPFEEWLAFMNSHEANTGYNRIQSYRTNATVVQLDQRGLEVASYKMEGIFPTEISSIDLAWDSNDTIEEFTVTFAIGNYWTINGNNKISSGVTNVSFDNSYKDVASNT